MHASRNGNEGLYAARFKSVKDAMQMGRHREVGSSVQDLVQRGPGTVSRCAVMLQYGVAGAYSEGDESADKMLRDMYHAAGMDETFEDETGYDLMHDRVHYFACAGHASRRALGALINPKAVDAAARFFMIPGSMWPFDLLHAARRVRSMVTKMLKESNVFTVPYDAGAASDMFKLSVFLGTSMELLKQDVLNGDPMYAAWDGFVILEDALRGTEETVCGVFKRFLDTIPVWAALVPGRHQYAICSQFYGVYTSRAYGISPQDARERAMYKCVLAYQAPGTTENAYPAMAWGGPANQLRAAVTNFAMMLTTGTTDHVSVRLDAGDPTMDEVNLGDSESPHMNPNDLLRRLESVGFSPVRPTQVLSAPNSAVSLSEACEESPRGALSNAVMRA